MTDPDDSCWQQSLLNRNQQWKQEQIDALAAFEALIDDQEGHVCQVFFEHECFKLGLTEDEVQDDEALADLVAGQAARQSNWFYETCFKILRKEMVDIWDLREQRIVKEGS